MDFYRNLNEREKKLVLFSLGLLGILLISFLINSVSSDLRNVKRIHKSTESDYLYVLQKANIISANIESQNIKLSGVSIYEHISDNEKLKLLDQESIELRNINGRENLTFTISRLDLLTDVVNELSLFFNKNPYDKWLAYGQSKTAASLLAIEFNRLMQNTGASGFAVHPGGIFTPLQRHLKKEEMIALGWIDKDGGPSELASNFFKTTSQGASTSLWCATNPDLKDIGGVFCEDCNIARRKSDIDKSMQRYFGVADWAIDSEEAQKLWQITEKMLEHL